MNSWPVRFPARRAPRSRKSPATHGCSAPNSTIPFSSWIWGFSPVLSWVLLNFSGVRKEGGGRQAPSPHDRQEGPPALRSPLDSLLHVGLERQPQLCERLLDMLNGLGAMAFKVACSLRVQILLYGFELHDGCSRGTGSGERSTWWRWSQAS